jgi:TfoX/Sxy family transcriptional regulator of competence genes
MAYDEMLAERIRTVLGRRKGISERRMFGGLAFMASGNMAVGIVDKDLMVRVGPKGHADALAQPHARVMDFTGKPSRGMVYVGPKGVATDETLKAWIERGMKYARSLPAK